MSAAGAKKKILVRLPNWLGDVILSSAFLQTLNKLEPAAEVHAILPEKLAGLEQYLPGVDTFHYLTRRRKGLLGTVRFGRELGRSGPFAVYYSLPNSFSSAWLGRLTGAHMRIGFKGEGRSFLLTRALPKPSRMHRADEYLQLLTWDYGQPLPPGRVALKTKEDGNVVSDSGPEVRLTTSNNGPTTSQAGSGPRGDSMPGQGGEPAIVLAVNFNSAAQSRRVEPSVAAGWLNYLNRTGEFQFILLGSPAEVEHNDRIIAGLDAPERARNVAGSGGLSELPILMRSAAAVLSTDSGPAHVAAAAGVPVVVIFGAGDESSTGPFKNSSAVVVRHPGLACAPCVRNTCQFGRPKCLVELSAPRIDGAVRQVLGLVTQ